MVLALEACCIKYFMNIINSLLYPSRIFADKAGANPRRATDETS